MKPQVSWSHVGWGGVSDTTRMTNTMWESVSILPPEKRKTSPMKDLQSDTMKQTAKCACEKYRKAVPSTRPVSSERSTCPTRVSGHGENTTWGMTKTFSLPIHMKPQNSVSRMGMPVTMMSWRVHVNLQGSRSLTSELASCNTQVPPRPGLPTSGAKRKQGPVIIQLFGVPPPRGAPLSAPEPGVLRLPLSL